MSKGCTKLAPILVLGCIKVIDAISFTNSFNLLAITPLRGGGGETVRGSNFKRQISHEDITTESHGAPDTLDARVFAKADGEHRSLWHDLPLFEVSASDGKPTGALHFVCEIPKWTRNRNSDYLPLCEI